ncbi:hypothetical protein [Streptomyces sp. UNOC14_S4]|uniref:hypothetical protein n=1 Tax=Streptomyces sp. UNOC14_S4 TaxID=2872340 RepID=UPI001E31D850|nr:hypothetical protein [Streptomyces sp. UNOC14_S4]MCC3767229.1 hypothetical protein [Streptomyces sp. UNOC14_S4]
MAERAVSRRARVSTVLAVFAAVTVLALAGVWLCQAQDRSGSVSDAPKTAAAQKSPQPIREVPRDTEAEEAKPQELPGVRECGLGAPVVEPQIITLNCANTGVVASGIKWSHYGADGAEGQGVVQVSVAANGAAANGAAPATYPARFRLYGAKNVDGLLAFTGIDVDYTGATPMGESKETYSIA